MNIVSDVVVVAADPCAGDAGSPVMTAADVLVELHTLKPGPSLSVPAIIKGIEACMADKAAFTPDDLAASLQQLRHRCRLAAIPVC